MTTYESPARDGAIERPASQNYYSDSTAAEAPKRLELGERAEQYIDRVSNALASGRLELWQLPPSLHWFYTRAWIEGRESRDDEVTRLNFEADYWYWRHANPRADFYRHAESELWRQAVSA